MTEKPKGGISVLIAGFRPSGRRFRGPAAALLSMLDVEPPGGAAIRTLLLPEASDDALLKAIETMDHYLPDAVIVLGEAQGQATVGVERVAVNVDGGKPGGAPRAADKGDPIDAAGPAGYFATLPVQQIVDRMRAGGVPARLSSGGGPSVENRLFYGLLHYVALRGGENWFHRQPPAGLVSRVGLIRIPPTTDEVAGAASMSVDVSLRGLKLAVAAIVEFLSPTGGGVTPQGTP